MNIKRAKQEIKNAVRAYLEKDEYGEYKIPEIRQRPILLMGPPGIGKTQIMEQIAGECDLALVSYTITHHTRQSAIGLPFIQERVYGGVKRSVTGYTMSEIIAAVYDRMEESGKKEGILFIDEINCVSETLAPMMLQFLQGKSFGNQKVPQGWIIVAAGNPPEYNKSVREFDVVTLDRVKVINVEAEYDVWKEYAYEAGIHPAILSYLDIHKENFYRMETTVDGKQFVTARGWEDLSEMMYACERLGMDVDSGLTIQYLQHPRTARDFANYYMLFNKYRTDYQVDEILDGTIRPGTLNKLRYAQFDERLEVVGLLLSRLNENFRRAYETDRYTANLAQNLKTFRSRLEQADTGEDTPEAIMRGILAAGRMTEEQRKKAGQNSRELRARYRRLLETLENYADDLKVLNAREGEEAEEVKKVKEEALRMIGQRFDQENDRLDTAIDTASRQLEAAFDFMEAAFGESQEMVVFITELSVGRYSVWFLQNNDCPRYYMYNKTLLFEDREADIKEQLDQIRDMQNT